MRRLPLAIGSIGLTALVCATAYATVSSYIPYRVVYSHLETGARCIGEHTMLAEIGIPAASQAIASAQPTRVLRQTGATVDYMNVNLAATSPRMVPTYVSDSFSSAGVLSYSMKLDVSALSAANGSTTSGRTRTVRAAKLYLISMAENLEALWPGAWRLRLQFVGLPSQSGLSGPTLHANTTWPYSSGSALLDGYYAELIDTDGSCP